MNQILHRAGLHPVGTASWAHLVGLLLAPCLFVVATGAAQGESGPDQVARMRISPKVVQGLVPGTVFRVDVWLDDPRELGGFQFTMRYDPEILAFESASAGPLLGSTGRDVIELPVDLEDGAFTYGAVSAPGAPGASTSGVIAEVELFALADGETDLSLDGVEVTNTANEPQETESEGSRVVVRGSIFLPAASTHK